MGILDAPLGPSQEHLFLGLQLTEQAGAALGVRSADLRGNVVGVGLELGNQVLNLSVLLGELLGLAPQFVARILQGGIQSESFRPVVARPT